MYKKNTSKDMYFRDKQFWGPKVRRKIAFILKRYSVVRKRTKNEISENK